jgi:hypothetical protein
MRLGHGDGGTQPCPAAAHYEHIAGEQIHDSR